MSFKEFDVNPMNCVSVLGYTWQCCLSYTDINLQIL